MERSHKLAALESFFYETGIVNFYWHIYPMKGKRFHHLSSCLVFFELFIKRTLTNWMYVSRFTSVLAPDYKYKIILHFWWGGNSCFCNIYVFIVCSDDMEGERWGGSFYTFHRGFNYLITSLSSFVNRSFVVIYWTLGNQIFVTS